MKLKQGMEEKEKKKKKNAEEKERVDTKLSNFSSDKLQKKALKIQLNFQQKVIRVKFGKKIFTLLSGGNMESIFEIRES